MTTPLILITGANGTTGAFAINQLLAQGANVRALVHKDDERAAKLRARGVDVVVGNIENFQSVRAALVGVRSAYFVYPLEAQILKAAVYFAQAAKEAGVQAVVNISQRTAHIDSASHSAQDHWFSERVFDWSGVPVIHLRPTLFMEWLLYPFQQPIIAGHNTLMLPGGNGRHSPVSAFDQGRVIATLLRDPAPHIGRTYHLYGPEELSYSEIAQAVGEGIGKDLRYVPEDPEAFVTRLLQAGVPPYVVRHLSAVFDEYRDNLLDGSNNTIEALTGVAPMTIKEFARQHAASLI
ncbi:NmrA family NAD(P)-binding protein [Duganella aceris]|uniref:NmrA family NAD(P)-binding protein n=1 Tax=Duganella aceris TaxID=2703883 RepID=A0ABX0FGM0_9BURK|nr:NmrA family NAD(P)-binding protein [Duganella aceris]NGZ83725.1 NmrA family NAD(P)-binding protein [Duganella aceris]